MSQMELYQILILTKWRLFILLLLIPNLKTFSLKLFSEGNEPNGVKSNIFFYKLEAFYPSLLLPYLISLFSNLFCEGNEPNGVKSNICFFTKWRLFILLLLLPYLISLSSNLFCESNEPNGVESNICFSKVEAIYPFITATLSDIIIFKTILCRQ
jgi:hypothetical protein